ncbi:DNA-directed RNA polymerase IV subunit 1-like [Chenopodium quinoa]|uniref:DNA-directed RNA polymerase IV subunit 1-like n=1 Tax=Chenopodium quinoa TaxID=63459 RepID=UPI000B7785BB|nr:DNA-directed RNA polymerase IV subunit 1-like [Chenopodium quinoa]XP_021754156.1 DNA-directed RNA polymerase IV subunit 1-like [Chenopodium quinoa]
MLSSMDDDVSIVNQVPVGILSGVHFNVLTENYAENISMLTIETPAGVTDPKLGFPNPTSQCATCGARSNKQCEGHFGVIHFPYTIIHPYFTAEVVQILNKICPGCKSLRRERRAKGAKTGAKHDSARVCNPCKYCAVGRPSIRFRVSTNDLFRKTAITVELTERPQNKYQLENFWDFIPKDVQVEESVNNNNNKRVLSPAQVYHLLKDVDPSFIKEFVSRKDALFLNCFAVTPNCHRVTELIHPFSTGQKLIFDDRTRAFRKLVDFRGAANELASRVLDCLKLSKLRLEKSNNDSDNVDVLNTSASKWMKEVVLTKRSDHIIRSVVTGDPYLKLCEIGIPCYIAERLQISDHLNSLNWEKLTASCNLRLLEKGEVYVRRKGELVSVREMEDFQFGDLIYRPLNDGDIMLINRPPSVHQHSMLALHVKILPINSVVSINPLCCSPLQGDFDGDCLHGYVPQSMEARVELRELVGLDKQLRNEQNGRNLLSLAHDSMTAAYLLTAEDVVLSKPQVQNLEMLCPLKLLSPPANSDFWTGKQIFSMLLPPEFDYASPSNGVQITKGELISSPTGSSWFRGDADGNFFESLINHRGGKFLDYLDAAQSVFCEYLSSRGFSVSLLDLYLCSDGHLRKNLVDEISCGLQEAEKNCHVTQLLVKSSIKYLLGDEEENQIAMSLEADKLCCEKQKSAGLSRASASAFKYVYQDIQNIAYQYAANDNALLAMMKSGSKGNLSKLVQQSMCLGLQHSLVPLTFRLPHKLSCSAWNELKERNSNFEEYFECNKNFIPTAVVEGSFVTGLNPLECFIHSVTCRDSTFSDHASVPGTLMRKLSFFMRDIQLAYDGTVRNAYGNQLVQFSYAVEKGESSSQGNDGSIGESMNACEAVGGHAVGALAASAFSEAAYGALDQPITVLEPSPLLNFKKVMESGSRKAKGSRTVSLFLSQKLRRLRYGSEYGVLEIKNHLEKLLFSDIVSTVMILYSPENHNRMQICPWVCHFHVSKDILKKMRLKVFSIIDALKRKCEATASLANVQLVSKNGCRSDAGNDTTIVCITATITESPRKSHADLYSVREVVIPSLLGSVVKGFAEVDKVEILWHDHPVESRIQKKSPGGELYLSVSLSANCKSKNMWSRLMNNCLPIMNLIDWTRSYPDDLSEINSAFGIDVAWRCFLENLRSAATDTGKTILPEHLILLADCLSVTGEFVGLSPKGVARQKALVSVSSPFMLACFNNAGPNFIKAAKKGTADGLLGSIDALAWGKRPCLGTGAQFDFMYSGKGHEIQKPVDIYNLLASHTSSHDSETKINLPPNDQTIVSEKLGAHHVNKWSNAKVFNAAIPKKFLQKHFSVDDIWKLGRIWKRILYKYEIDDKLSDIDKAMLLMALKFHPHREEKIGSGAVDIKVGHHAEYKDSRCFVLERDDGTFEDFSYKKCVFGALEIIAPSRAKLYQTRWAKNGTTQKV